MTTAHILGFPRIGARRELKHALERHWRGDVPETALIAAGRELRARHWQLQHAAGLDFVTVGDFAWYDHVLQTMAHLGCIPERFGFDPRALTLDQYFALARGTPEQPALELTKWFDTNYHYLVPEWTADTQFEGGVSWLLDEIREAQILGYAPKVALLGPLTLLWLGKLRDEKTWVLGSRLELLPALIPAYRRLLERIRALGVAWVQIDEPMLGLDLETHWLEAFPAVYAALQADAPQLLLTTYFESVAERAELLKQLPVAGVHLDLVRGSGQLPEFLNDWPQDKVLSLGVVDGRNVWRADLDAALALLRPAADQLGDRLWISASCSLLHVPIELRMEKNLDPVIRPWLSFATQKLHEIAELKSGIDHGELAIGGALADSRRALALRRAAGSTRVESVRERVAQLADSDSRRQSPFAARNRRQRMRLKLPLLPTTTIGSFSQTSEIRKARAAFRRGALGAAEYELAMRAEIRQAIAQQEELGLDVLVHGEAERNDMVQYFAEQLSGCVVTENGWVQSYGSRCVKPPIIYGDVARPAPMTVAWSRYAQSLTSRPVKGMLTGPVTILQWSFVREDQPRRETAFQIALALRDEVRDLERAGMAIIQIDEPALREGLPLKRGEWSAYLNWAVTAFRLASSGVADETQIHTHMCYSEFNDILPSIAALDADVITIESSRSGMELLNAFRGSEFHSEVGPGVYDVHSPRVPDAREVIALLERAAAVVDLERLWVNPDCGLKTRDWPETAASLASLVAAAQELRRRKAREIRPAAAAS
jgi:5-methyltetrahydropteroyltriglutamate--homocysteine methyltransferase